LVRGILGTHLTVGAVVLSLHGAVFQHTVLLDLALLMTGHCLLRLVAFA